MSSSSSRDRQYLADIIDAARRAQTFVRDQTRDQFFNDERTHHAVVRQFEIIGEAANRVSEQTRARINLPWRRIIGMRHRLIHDYGNVNLATVWDTVQTDLDSLIALIEASLQGEAD